MCSCATTSRPSELVRALQVQCNRQPADLSTLSTSKRQRKRQYQLHFNNFNKTLQLQQSTGNVHGGAAGNPGQHLGTSSMHFVRP